MLVSVWQLRTTVYVIFLALCQGQEHVRACDREFCYGRSVERQSTDPNDLRKWNSSRGETFERGFVKDLHRRGEINQRISQIERHIDRETWLNFVLRKENRHENSVLNNRRSVTRHLDDGSDELRGGLRRLDARDATRRTEYSRAQPQTLRRLDENDQTKRERVERDETIRRLDTVRKDRHLENKREESHANTRERMENLKTKRLTRERNDNLKERYEYPRQLYKPEAQTLRRLEDHKAQRDVKRRSDDTRNSKFIDKRLIQRVRESTQRSYESNFEHVERGETLMQLEDREAQRDVSRRSEDNSVERHEALRQGNKLEVRRAINERNFESERERGDTLRRVNDRQAQRKISRREERYDILRQLNERDVGIHSDDTRDTQRIDERLPRREQDSRQYRDENKHEREDRGQSLRWLEECQDQRERHETLQQLNEHKVRRAEDTQLINTQLLHRERESTHRREENKQEQVKLPDSLRRLEVRKVQRHGDRLSADNREDRYEILKQLDVREVQRDVSRRSDDTRETPLIDERLFHKERESIQRRDENKRERVERHDSFRRLNYREVRRLEGKSSESCLRLFTEHDDRLYQKEYKSRQYLDENKRERVERYETLRRLGDSQYQSDVNRPLEDNRDINRRSDDTRESQSRDENLSRRERESVHRGDENRRERVDRHETLRRKDELEEQRNVARRLINTSESLRNERETTENRNEREREKRHETSRKFKEQSINRLVDDNLKSRLPQTARTFIIKQNYEIDNHRYIEDDYAVKSTTFLKKGSLFLDQGVILAFLIMKTIIGKDNLKHQIPQNIREAVGKMGF